VTTSITSPGTQPPTSQDRQPSYEDSLVDVWVYALRHGADPAKIVESIRRWVA
jgi:hypothetical protein